jgi:putative FmdB family regulatory protein
MPLYDYDCAACGRRFEVVHGVHVEGPTVCPICGKGPIRKAISAAAVHYKGSGWAKKERRSGASSGASKSAAEGGASEGGSKPADGGEDSGSKAPSKDSKTVEAASPNTSD